MKKCNKCSEKLTEKNWFPSLKKRNSRVCRECHLKIGQQWRERNRKKQYEYTKKWLSKNPDYQSKNLKRHRSKLRVAALIAYGGKCSWCGIEDFEVLDIDHIKNDGCKQRKEGIFGITLLRWLRDNNYPKSNFQILCRNCNWKKHLNKK